MNHNITDLSLIKSLKSSRHVEFEFDREQTLSDFKDLDEPSQRINPKNTNESMKKLLSKYSKFSEKDKRNFRHFLMTYR